MSRLHPCDGEAVYSTDELYIRFTCRMVVDHYGVPGSPVWLAPDEDTIEIVEIEAEGVTLNPRKIPQGERDRFFAYADDLTFAPVEEDCA